MGKAKEFLTKIPAGLLSLFTLSAILWLTLAPKPLGENPPPLFPGADKIAHALMFGGFAMMLLLDYQRHHRWGRVLWEKAFSAAFISSATGVAIEVAQKWMGLGRGFEFADILADMAGSFMFAWIFFMSQRVWISLK